MITPKSGVTIRERVSPHLVIERTAEKLIAEDTDCHVSKIYADSGPFGQMLFMDGYIQSAEKDSHIYHETLVQPAMMYVQMLTNSKEKPIRVLIGGGGELVTAYEVLKNPNVVQCDMIDIDGAVVNMAKKELGKFHFDSWKDERLNLVIGDVWEWVSNHISSNNEIRYDLVIMDICDPTEGYGPARLYTREWYEKLSEIMTDDGIFVTQSTALQATQYQTAARIRKTAEHVFGKAMLYKSFVPSFIEQWGFTIAGKNLPSDRDIKSGLNIDKTIEKCYGAEKKNLILQYYDEDTHIGMFCGLGKDLREKIEAVEVASLDNLVCFLQKEE